MNKIPRIAIKERIERYKFLLTLIWRPLSLRELTPIIFNMGFNSLRLGGLHIN